MRPAIGIRITVARIITAAEAAISHAGAAPRMIRDGIVTGAIGGMKAVTWPSVPSGLSLTANPAKSEIRISMGSGVVELWISSWRGTRAPAPAWAAAYNA